MTTPIPLITGPVKGDDVNKLINSVNAAVASVQAVAASEVEDVIVDGVTAKAPSQNAVFDALANKQPLDTQLTDIANLVYSNNELKVLRVNAEATAFELAEGGGTGEIDDLSDAISDGQSVFLGANSGIALDEGQNNTAVGVNALTAVEDGSFNTAVGNNALYSTVNGDSNTGIGAGALSGATGGDNTAVGYASGQTVTSGTANVFIGTSCDTSDDEITNAICIGANALIADSNTVQIGDINITNMKIGGDAGTIQTGNTANTTSAPWALGAAVTNTVTLDTTAYIEIEIDGTPYKLALATITG